MQENNFEKQVHIIMEDFKKSPSDNVWAKLEADLNQQRKKKFFWLPSVLLSVCFLLVSFLLNDLRLDKALFINQSFDVANSTAVEADKRVNKNERVPKEISGNGDVLELPVKSELKKPKIGFRNGKIALKQRPLETVYHNPRLKKYNFYREIEKTTTGEFSFNKKYSIYQEEGLADKAREPVSNEDNYNYNEVLTTNSEKLSFKKFFISNIETIKSTNTLMSFPIDIGNIKTPGKNAFGYQTPQINKNSTIKKQDSWYLEFFLTGGFFSTNLSPIHSDLFSGDPNKSSLLEVANYASSPGQVDSSVYSQSYLKKGDAVSIGFNLWKPVSKKTSVSFGAGIRYAYTNIVSSSYHPVFNQSTNAISNQYFDDKNYKNEFYFVDIPLQVQSLIGNGKRIPLYWNVGVIYSRLVKNRSPQYSLEQNAYLDNSASLARNIFGISAGVDVEILRGKSTAFKIGPSLYFSFSKVANKNIYANTYYQFAGIRLRKTF